MVDFTQRLNVPGEVLFRELEGEAVILNLETETYFGLDDIGTRIWEVVTATGSVDDAFQTLLVEYEVEPERLRCDMNTLLSQLIDHGLLTIDERAET